MIFKVDQNLIEPWYNRHDLVIDHDITVQHRLVTVKAQAISTVK